MLLRNISPLSGGIYQKCRNNRTSSNHDLKTGCNRHLSFRTSTSNRPSTDNKGVNKIVQNKKLSFIRFYILDSKEVSCLILPPENDTRLLIFQPVYSGLNVPANTCHARADFASKLSRIYMNSPNR